MIVGVSANLLSRRTASPDLGRRAFGVWAFAAIGSTVALARAATLPTVASLRFGPHPPLEADGRGFVAGLAKSGFQVGENILLAQHDCQGSMANANTLAAELLRAQPAVLHVSATPSAQAVNSAHGVAPQVPVVFSSVTDPLGAGIVNDALGHAAGDACLQAVAQVVKNAARLAGELAARQGGEEFVLVLPSATVRGALDTAQYIQESLTAKLPHLASPIGPWVTWSLGVAVDVPDPDQPRDHLLVCADRALYSAKDEGRSAISLARTRALAAEQAAPWRFAVVAKTTNNPSPFVLSLSKDLVQETKASTSSARTGVGSSDYGALL